jgi:outer membrane cobalamin receptor
MSLGVCVGARGASPETDASGALSDNGLEQIIVTARRRAESMMDVPVSVTALSAADIERYSATDLRKIGELAPQVILAEDLQRRQRPSAP